MDPDGKNVTLRLWVGRAVDSEFPENISSCPGHLFNINYVFSLN